jgi:hypothetical protein
MEAFADSSVRVGCRVQPVVEVVDVLGSEQVESVDEVQVVIASVATRAHDLACDLANTLQCQRSDRKLVGSRGCVEALVPAEDGRAGMAFDARADDRRDEREWGGWVAVADGVGESVQRGCEGALAHGVPVEDVDSRLDADEVGWEISSSSMSVASVWNSRRTPAGIVTMSASWMSLIW